MKEHASNPSTPTPVVDAAIVARHGDRVAISVDGAQPHWRVEPTRGAIRGDVLWLHGLCENAYRFLPFADWLARRGLRVLMFHLLGHGIDPNQEADWHWLASAYLRSSTAELNARFAELDAPRREAAAHQVAEQCRTLRRTKIAAQLAQTHSMLTKLDATRPCFIGGHSLGGLLAYETALASASTHPWRGIVLSSPALAPRSRPHGSQAERIALGSSWQLRTNRFLRPLAWLPDLARALRFDTDVAWSSRAFSDLAIEQQLHATDPLIGRRVPLPYLARIEQQMARTRRRRITVPIPTFTAIARDDAIVSGPGCERIIRDRTPRNISDRLIVDEATSAHELLRSSRGDFIRGALERWLEARLSGPDA